MEAEAFYRRNSNGRYEKIGYQFERVVPEGLHLVYVKKSSGCTTTITYFDLDFDQVGPKAFTATNCTQITDLVMKACELYPSEKLTEEEWAEWEAFKKTKAGKKLCKGMYRKSAADIAKHILDNLVK